jgi:hypothetical protein
MHRARIDASSYRSQYLDVLNIWNQEAGRPHLGAGNCLGRAAGSSDNNVNAMEFLYTFQDAESKALTQQRYDRVD